MEDNFPFLDYCLHRWQEGFSNNSPGGGLNLSGFAVGGNVSNTGLHFFVIEGGNSST